MVSGRDGVDRRDRFDSVIIEPASDEKEIIDFYSDPRIKHWTKMDNAPDLRFMAKRAVHEGQSYRLSVSGKLSGFILIEMIFSVAIAHIAVHPRMFGKRASDSCQAVMAYLFAKGVQEIQLHIPNHNLSARYLAGRLGFERYDIQHFAWPKDGIHYDLICYRKEKP